MPNFRRAKVAGGTFFFTLVTARRSPILCEPFAASLLRQCFRDARLRRPFRIDAIVVLPDHMHTMWTLPQGDSDFSRRWSDFKANFTRRWLRAGGSERAVSSDQQRQGRRGVWQPRFMEHTIRDEEDFHAHLDYIHFNPVKHGLVQRPIDWKLSSIHRYARMAWYARDWGCAGEVASVSSIDAELIE